MLNRLFVAALLALFALGIADWGHSSITVCNPISDNAEHTTDKKQSPEDCPALRGPIGALVNWTTATLDHHGEAVIAVFTIVLAFSTILLWNSTRGLHQATLDMARGANEQIKIAKAAADQAQRSADIAERSLTLTDRPWMDVDLEITGPLKFLPETIEIKIKATFKNVGKSPATYVHFYYGICPDVGVAAAKAEEIIESRRHIAMLSVSWGQVVFPGKDGSREGDISITREEFIARIKEMDAVPTEEPLPPFTTNNPGIYAVAIYGLPSTGRTGRSRFTTLLLELAATNPEHDGWDGNEQGEVAADKLHLVHTFVSGETI